jgi:hypothetical protein
VPVACPIGWSAKDRRGHSQTDRQTCLPGLQHVVLIAETALIRKRSLGANLGATRADNFVRPPDGDEHAAAMRPRSRTALNEYGQPLRYHLRIRRSGPCTHQSPAVPAACPSAGSLMVSHEHSGATDSAPDLCSRRSSGRCHHLCTQGVRAQVPLAPLLLPHISRSGPVLTIPR